ncbi:unnamed protein product [Ceratitis capitata]|uniref:(Mediterranean fruit fly) hypothetical protein n=1 Tax=Ceratitis capitata TaxID=7213 RepID=A0A811UXL9_CERCA|nr:unnamed protein product [Ceratitis capitata]
MLRTSGAICSLRSAEKGPPAQQASSRADQSNKQADTPHTTGCIAAFNFSHSPTHCFDYVTAHTVVSAVHNSSAVGGLSPAAQQNDQANNRPTGSSSSSSSKYSRTVTLFSCLAVCDAAATFQL